MVEVPIDQIKPEEDFIAPDGKLEEISQQSPGNAQGDERPGPLRQPARIRAVARSQKTIANNRIVAKTRPSVLHDQRCHLLSL